MFPRFKRDVSVYVYATFAIVGGFLEAYTYLLRGGVFCNAQTGNVVMLVIELVQGEFYYALRYVYSITAYVAGIILSTALPAKFKKFNWCMAVTILEIAAFTGIAFIPSSASDWYVYVAVAFLCSIQYNTFTQLKGMALATTFCTNNIRQSTIHLYKAIANKDKSEYKKSALYFFIIVCFALGAGAGAFISGGWGNYSILICAALLVPVLCFFIADIIKAGKDGAAADADGEE